ncbi:cation-translocating P-type ATPase [Thermodesulfovibrionales bacterium]|nr:cation-translocating P-type ATPase [Thermodesulfovibrionales bacterium]MCL0061841.1 cation-translocating P-type ATPase [Thermodesulfovibrionales bacterium]
MKKDLAYFTAVNDTLKEMKGIAAVTSNSVVGSAVILYDEKRVTQNSILAKLDELFSARYRPERESSIKTVTGSGIPKPRSLLRDLLGVSALAFITVYFLIKSAFGKTPLNQTIFSLPALTTIFFGYPILKKAAQDIAEKKEYSLHQFMAFTAIVALFMSKAMTAIEIIFIMRVGTLVKDYVTERSRRAIRNILSLSEKRAYRVIGGVEVALPVSELKVADIVAVHTGERIPVDGAIVLGHATIDDAHITGRSVPEYRSTGSKVFAGTLIHDGFIHIRAEKVGRETYLARMLEMVEESLATRAPVMDQGDVLSARLTRLGIIVSIGTLIVTQDVYRVLTVLLIMSCPCATVLAATTAVSAAIANAARKNILVKGGLYLEKVGRSNVICFDKTGTVTCSQPEVESIVIHNKKISEHKLISVAATAELHSHHPLAWAIRDKAREMAIDVHGHAACQAIVGRGMEASIDDHKILVGNKHLMRMHGIRIGRYGKDADYLTTEGQSTVFVARSDKLIGLIGIKNRIRPDAKRIIQHLRNDGIREVHLITGDQAVVANKIAKELEVDFCHADLLPEDKAAVIEKLISEGKLPIMVGDGVNDALAMSKAHIGIAMGAGGSDVAIEAADIVLATSELWKISYVRALSRETIRIIEQNYGITTYSNLAGVILGAMGLITPLAGGFLHIFHSLGVSFNSARLLGFEMAELPAVLKPVCDVSEKLESEPCTVCATQEKKHHSQRRIS